MRGAAALLLAAWAGACGAGRARAALQSSAGAKTSATPTADPRSHLHAGQVFFDPSPAGTSSPPEGIEEYQLDVEFDSTELHVVQDSGVYDINGVAPYSVDSFSFRTVQTSGMDDMTYITIDGSDHSATATSPPPQGNVNLFTVVFQLNSGYSDNTPLAVDLGSLGDTSDYLGYYDESNPNSLGPEMRDTYDQISPSEADFTIAQVTPEPASLALLPLAALLLGRRRQRGKSARP